MKNLILTGSTSGIGYAIFKQLINQKYNLILISKNKTKLLRQQKINQNQINSKIHIYQCDLSNLSSVNKIISKIIKKFKYIDILINNAGQWGPIGKFETNNWNKWIKAININLLSPVLLIKSVLPGMKKKKQGKIIQLSGGGATKPMPNFCSYSVSKTGIVRFIETIARENEKHNIHINSIAPGSINTNMLKIALKAGSKKVGKNYQNLIKQKKNGGTGFKKVLKLIMFLLNDNKINGRLISAIWDKYEGKNFQKKLKNKNNFTLERKV
jgi:3-oxoacyl-[acyl-carrier protein] reductase